MRQGLVIILAFCLFFSFSVADLSAQELIQDSQTIVKGKVLRVVEEGERELTGLNISSEYQNIEVEILEGEDRGKVVLIENDYVLLEEGELVYVLRTVRGEAGDIVYGISDPYRINR